MSGITPPDILAGADVLHDLNESYDQLDPETAYRLLVATEELQVQVKAAISNLRQQLIQKIEQPITVDGKTISKSQQMKWRPRQAQIQQRVIDVCLGVIEETGEVLPKEEAVALAVRLMGDMFVSPSTEPKVTGLREIGFTSLKKVADEEFTKWELNVEEPKK